jgi:hypothetical protein
MPIYYIGLFLSCFIVLTGLVLIYGTWREWKLLAFSHENQPGLKRLNILNGLICIMIGCIGIIIAITKLTE